MAFQLDGKLVVGISSRALFDLERENAIFEKLTDHFIIMTGSMAEGTQDSV